MKTIGKPFRIVVIAMTVLGISIAGCKKDKDRNTAQNDPSITSFSPAEAAIGNTVVISGKNFSLEKTENKVMFNGVAAAVTSAKTTELSVTVPEGASNGKITVTVNDITATSATDFKLNASAPQVSGFAPLKGAAGLEVTITGQRFTNQSKAFFGALPATTTYVNNTTLKAIVPADVLTAKIRVANGNLESLSAADFIAPPRITGLSVDRAEEGEVITITGVNFSENKENVEVGFGNGLATAAEIESATATEIKVKAPVAGNDGKVGVTVSDLTGQSANDFIYKATLADFSPKSGAKGTLVTLKGKRLGAGATVEINGINAAITFRATDQTEIRFHIPTHASVVGDKIKLKSKTLEYQTAEPFVVPNVWKKLRDAVAGQYYEKGFMFIHDKEIGIGLGKNATGGLNSTYMKYNTQTNTWSAPIAIPAEISPRYDASYATLGNRVFVIGGMLNASTYYRGVSFLELGDGSWKTADALKTSSAGGVAFVINNKLYAGMGNTGLSTATYKISEFDNTNLSWKEGGFNDLQGAGYINNSCFVINNFAYIGQGKDAANTAKKGFFLYGGFNSFGTAKEAPVATDGASSFTYNGKGYVKAVHDLYEYDPAKNDWKLINSTDAIYVNYIAVVNNRILGIGYNGEVYEYIP